MARVARAEQQPAATGTTLVVMVGLGVAFLLFMAFLNVVKSGNLINDSNLLYAALIFYCGAGTLYLGFGVTGIPSYVRFASLATWAGLIANTGAVAHRWYEAGHPPFASIYEMLLSFVWTLAVLTLIAEKKFGVKVIGTVTMPVAIVGVVLMQLLRTEVHPLVPALQSTWLHVHVTLAMLAYAACALSFALAMMFLIKDKMKTETFLAATSLFGIGTYLGVLTRFEKWGGLSVIAWDPERKSEVFLAKSVRLFIVIPDLGWLMLLVLAAVAAPLVLYLAWRKTGKENSHRHRQSRSICKHPSAGSGAGFLPAAGAGWPLSVHSTRTVCSPPAWPPAHSSFRVWLAESSFRCCICCCCGGVRISSACCRAPRNSTASPTRPSPSHFPYSP